MDDRRDVIVCRFGEVAGRMPLAAALDAIFFEASHTKAFESEAVRAIFRRRWLGRYLEGRPDLAHLLFVDGQISPETLAGYVIGAHDDPALNPQYEDIGYFHLIANVTRQFPAHLHINLRSDLRGLGLGSRLISCFVNDAATAGIAGVHVVTGAGLRNVGFYRRNGFVFAHTFAWKGKELIFLGRRTQPLAVAQR